MAVVCAKEVGGTFAWLNLNNSNAACLELVPDTNGTAGRRIRVYVVGSGWWSEVTIYVCVLVVSLVRAAERISVSRAMGEGRRLTARGSIRFGRLATG